MSGALSRVCQWFFPATASSSESWVEMKPKEEREREVLEQKRKTLHKFVENYEMLYIFHVATETPSDKVLDEQWRIIVAFARKDPAMPVPQRPGES